MSERILVDCQGVVFDNGSEANIDLYWDPVEDEKCGCVDANTGWYYIEFGD